MLIGRTSESVAAGHPDKVADIISDYLVDLCKAISAYSRCAIETLVCKNEVIVRGEVGGIDPLLAESVEALVRDVVRHIGYDFEGFDFKTLKVNSFINGQSSDIAQGVVQDTRIKGAGDQGMMFGYCTSETEVGLPLQFHIAKELMDIHNEICGKGINKDLGIRPDAKSQFSLGSKTDSSQNTLLLSISHEDGVDVSSYADKLVATLLERYPNYELYLKNCKRLLNPTGRFVICGPAGDTGLTGRKIVVDSYGGACPVGGGAFSGKDESKVDRSAAYMARYLARQVLKDVDSDKDLTALVSISYAIGQEEPTSVSLQTNFLTPNDEVKIAKNLASQYNLTPQGICDFLKLREIEFVPTALNGHFGLSKHSMLHKTNSFTWER